VAVLGATVIIPTYNRAELLRQTLVGLTRQDCTDFEVVVADDGSSDDTEEVVGTFADRLPVRHLFQPDLGYRVAAARNLGIRAAQGEVCVLLDSGMLPGTRLVSRHLAVHRRSADRVAVVGYAWAFRGTPEPQPEVVAAIDHQDVDRSITRLAATGPAGRDLRDDYFYDRFGDDLSGQPAPWVTFWGCNVSVRRADLFVVGLFDEAYRSWGFEDLDLGYRLCCAGVRFELSREAAAIHAPHEMGDAAANQCDLENKRYFHSKFRNRVSELAVATPYNLEINALLLAEDTVPAPRGESVRAV
jgi:glycosyltransferase involved in cell wall biosynthesis